MYFNGFIIQEYKEDSYKGVDGSGFCEKTANNLQVKTNIPMPTVEIDSELEKKFLGYDYAYENGDNYSAVYNEVPFVFSEFELNENGLFQTKEEIVEYISKREEYEKTHKPYTLEVGDFTIFEVYEVIL